MAISAITLAELSAGPHEVRRNDEQDAYDEHAERARRLEILQRAENEFDSVPRTDSSACQPPAGVRRLSHAVSAVVFEKETIMRFMPQSVASRTVLVTAAGLILAAAGLAGTGGAAASIRPGAGIPLPTDGMLNGLAATSAGHVWAVGQTSAGDPLILRGNGASWQRLPPENRSGGTFGLLYAVTATSAKNAWAAGFDRMLHWNGTSWAGVRVPHGGRVLGLAAASASDIWAVGYYFNKADQSNALALHWNGIAWRPVSGLNLPDLDPFLWSVAIVSAKDVWAVGSAGAGRALILNWNGATWTQYSSPTPGRGTSLRAVAFTSADNGWAFGATHFRKTPLILHWNGATWTQVPGPVSAPHGELKSVVAISPGNVWAAGGNRRALIVHWNGAVWKQVPTPIAGALNALTFTSAGNGWAAGQHQSGRFNYKTVLLHWDGATWKVN